MMVTQLSYILLLKMGQSVVCVILMIIDNPINIIFKICPLEGGTKNGMLTLNLFQEIQRSPGINYDIPTFLIC